MDSWTGIVLVFDPNTQEILRNLQKELLEDHLIQGNFDLIIPPHITLIEHKNLLLPHYIDVIEDFMALQTSFTVNFSSVAYFISTRVLFLNPKESSALHDFRENLILELRRAGLDYERGPLSPWIPHSTILNDLNATDFGRAMPYIQKHLNMDIGRPFQAKVAGIHMFSYPPYKADHIYEFSPPPQKMIEVNQDPH